MTNLIFFLIMFTGIQAQADYPDFYAVKIDQEISFTIFVRFKNCLLYESPRRMVLYLSQDQKISWKIAKLKSSLLESGDCSQTSSGLDDQFEATGSVLASGNHWRTTAGYWNNFVNIYIETLWKCKENWGMKIVRSLSKTFENKEECERHLVDSYGVLRQTIFFSFDTQSLQCSHSLHENVKLQLNQYSAMFILSSSCKNEDEPTTSVTTTSTTTTSSTTTATGFYDQYEYGDIYVDETTIFDLDEKRNESTLKQLMPL